jgi:poly-gamma-glutamate synthesis protein (capsule biosynthesis protein)
MRLLCLGDIAISEEITPPWPHPLAHCVEDDFWVLCNWELPLGKLINPIPRSCGPRILATPNSVKTIVNWAPGIASLANNHIVDAGKDGLAKTIASLQRIGLKTVGAGLSAHEIQKPLFWETSEGRLAVVNWVFPETHPDCMVIPGPNCWPGLCEARNAIYSLKQEVDWLLLVVHWSDEQFSFPRPEDRLIARELAELGVDMIIGHHPHVVRGMEIIGSCPVFYSLGNFFFSNISDGQGGWISREAPRNREGLGIEITFSNGKRPEYNILSFWRTRRQVVLDSFYRAARRMKLVSHPLQALSDTRYNNWYSLKRSRFFSWEYRLYFRFWQIGIPGAFKYLFQQTSKQR